MLIDTTPSDVPPLPFRPIVVQSEAYDFFSSPQMPAEPISELVAKKTYCHDPKLVGIWNTIRREKEVRELLDYTTESPDCKDMFEVKYVDLNLDRRPEILVRARTIQFCGAVGNCDLWVLDTTGKQYRVLLHADDYVDRSDMGEQVRPTKTHGYSDLLLKGHFSAGNTSFSTYKFDGKKYRESRCLYETYKYDEDNKPKWYFVKCSEFYRGQGL